MKKIISLFILYGLLTVSCKSELTLTDNNFDKDMSVDAKVDVTGRKDAKKDLSAPNDMPTNDTPDSSDVGVDQSDTGSTIKGSAGCDVGEGIPEGENTFMLEGRTRSYVMRLPQGYTNDLPGLLF